MTAKQTELMRTIAQAYARRHGTSPKVTLGDDDVALLRAHVAGIVDARREAFGFAAGFDGREVSREAQDAYALDPDALAEQLADDLRLSHAQALEVAGLVCGDGEAA